MYHAVFTAIVLDMRGSTHWLEQGLNIVAIQRLMGHADTWTTMRYIFVSVEQKNKALATLEVRQL